MLVHCFCCLSVSSFVLVWNRKALEVFQDPKQTSPAYPFLFFGPVRNPISFSPEPAQNPVHSPANKPVQPAPSPSLTLARPTQPLVPPSCGFIFSRTSLTTRNAIEVATRTSFLTITHCSVSKVFLFCRHLSWDKRKYRLVRSRKREKPHYVKFYLIRQHFSCIIAAKSR